MVPGPTYKARRLPRATRQSFHKDSLLQCGAEAGDQTFDLIISGVSET